MNKEEIYNLLDKLDRDEWCTDLYKTPLTWCELYDIRDYITNLEKENKQLQQELNEKNKIIEEFKEWLKSEVKQYEEDYENALFSNVEYLTSTNILNKIEELEKGEDNENTN